MDKIMFSIILFIITNQVEINYLAFYFFHFF